MSSKGSSAGRARKCAKGAEEPQEPPLDAQAPSRKQKFREGVDVVEMTGKKCKPCGIGEEGPDPVAKAVRGVEEPMPWGYPPIALKQGRILDGFYKKTKGWSFGTLVKKLGSDPDERDRFASLRETTVQRLIDGGGAARIDWNQENEKLLLVKKRTADEMVEPEDAYWDYDYYVRVHGDPHTNGMGHRVVTSEGGKRKEVIVPGEPIRKRRRVQSNIIDLVETLDSNKNMQLVDNQLERKKADLDASISPLKATGVFMKFGSLQLGSGSSSSGSGRATLETPTKSKGGRDFLTPKGKAPVEPAEQIQIDIDDDGAEDVMGFGFQLEKVQKLEDGPEESSDEEPVGRGQRRAGNKKAAAQPRRAAAKAKPAAKPNAAPGSSKPPGGGGGRGRPALVLKDEVDKVVEKFLNSQRSDADFYGCGQESTKYYKTLKKRHADIKKAIDTADSLENLQLNLRWRLMEDHCPIARNLRLGKKMDAVIASAQSIKDNGEESAAFAETHQKVSHYNSLDPDVAVHLPLFASRGMFKRKCLNSEGRAFLCSIGIDKMKAVFGEVDATVEPAQVSFISDRLVSTCKQNNAKTLLAELIPKALPSEVVDYNSSLYPTCLQQLLHVHAIVHDLEADPDEVFVAADACVNEKMPICHALKMYPTGRQMITDAKERAKRREKATECDEKASAQLKALESALAAEDLDIDAEATLFKDLSQTYGQYDSVPEESVESAKKCIELAASRCTARWLELVDGVVDGSESYSDVFESADGAALMKYIKDIKDADNGEFKHVISKCQAECPTLQVMIGFCALIKKAGDFEDSDAKLEHREAAALRGMLCATTKNLDVFKEKQDDLRTYMTETFDREHALVKAIADTVDKQARDHATVILGYIKKYTDTYPDLKFYDVEADKEGKDISKFVETAPEMNDEVSTAASALVRIAAGTHDLALNKETQYCHYLAKCLHPVAKLATAMAAPLTMSQAFCDVVGKAVDALADFKIFVGTLTEADEGTLFKTTGDQGHMCHVFDGEFQVPKSHMAFGEMADNMTKQISDGWCTKWTNAKAELIKHLPDGHAAAKDVVLEHRALMTAMLKNPAYEELANASGAALSEVKAIKALQKQRVKFIAPELFEELSSQGLLGASCVTTTYVIFKMGSELAKFTNVRTRKIAAQRLKAELVTKTQLGNLGKDTAALLEQLCTAESDVEDVSAALKLLEALAAEAE
ncbi:unnamed protein product [Prorocentrum cordatum]|uniref:Uncharacterized protein n=1 Tax=Prorocentrum cordatum TaxID=2364126 RepID=A0ABN9YGH3_9DINO|nr:unnamed protein product [Polarella glacialis]